MDIDTLLLTSLLTLSDVPDSSICVLFLVGNPVLESLLNLIITSPLSFLVNNLVVLGGLAGHLSDVLHGRLRLWVLEAYTF